MPYLIKAQHICRLVKEQLNQLKSSYNSELLNSINQLANLVEMRLESKLHKSFYLKQKKAFLKIFNEINAVENAPLAFAIDSPKSFQLGFIYWGLLQVINSNRCEDAQFLLSEIALNSTVQERFIQAPKFVVHALENYYKHQDEHKRQSLKDLVNQMRVYGDCIIWQEALNMILSWENSITVLKEFSLDFPEFDLKPILIHSEPTEELLPGHLYLYKRNNHWLYSTISPIGQMIKDQRIDIDSLSSTEVIYQKAILANIRLNDAEKSFSSYRESFLQINYLFQLIDYQLQVINDLLRDIEDHLQYPEYLSSKIESFNLKYSYLKQLMDFQNKKILTLEDENTQSIQSIIQNYLQRQANLSLSFANFEHRKTSSFATINYPLFNLKHSLKPLTSKDYFFLGFGFILTALAIPVLSCEIFYASAFTHFHFFGLFVLITAYALALSISLAINFGYKYYLSMDSKEETIDFTKQELPHHQTAPSL